MAKGSVIRNDDPTSPDSIQVTFPVFIKWIAGIITALLIIGIATCVTALTATFIKVSTVEIKVEGIKDNITTIQGDIDRLDVKLDTKVDK